VGARTDRLRGAFAADAAFDATEARLRDEVDVMIGGGAVGAPVALNLAFADWSSCILIFCPAAVDRPVGTGLRDRSWLAGGEEGLEFSLAPVELMLERRAARDAGLVGCDCGAPCIRR